MRARIPTLLMFLLAPGAEEQSPADWKRWLLWAVLLAGVTALAIMARSLLRAPHIRK